MWSSIKFKLHLKQFKDRKEFLDQPVKTFTQIYQLLADKLFLSDETVKSWTRDNNNGPGDDDTKKRLAELLNVDINIFEQKEGNDMNNAIVTNNGSNAVDIKIAECIKEVYSFLEVLLANDKEKGIPKVLSNGYIDIINDCCKKLTDLSILLPDDLCAEVQCYVSEDELSLLKSINSAWNDQYNVFDAIGDTVWPDYTDYDEDDYPSFLIDPIGTAYPPVDFEDDRIYPLLEKNKEFYPFLRDILYDPQIDEIDYKEYNDCEDDEVYNLGQLMLSVKLYRDYATFFASNLIIGYVVKSVGVIEKLRKQLLSERQEVSKETVCAGVATLMNESGISEYSLSWGYNSPLIKFMKKRDEN